MTLRISSRAAAATAVIAFCTLCGRSSADTLKLKDGTVLYGQRIAIMGDKVLFKVGGTESRTIKQADVEGFEKNDLMTAPAEAEQTTEPTDAVDADGGDEDAGDGADRGDGADAEEPAKTTTRTTAENDAPATAEDRAATLAALEQFQTRFAEASLTPPRLVDLATWCREQKLWLEAEECLRGALLVDPDLAAAKKAYEELAAVDATTARSVGVAKPTSEPLAGLHDGGFSIDPPARQSYVSISLVLQPSSDNEQITISPGSLSGGAGDRPARFVGILATPATDVQGVRKDQPYPKSSAQCWETLIIARKGTGWTARLRNTQRPQIPVAKPATGKPAAAKPAAARNTAVRSNRRLPEYRILGDGSYYEEDSRGTYQAIFLVSEGQRMTQIQFQDEPAIRLLHEMPSSLDALASNEQAATEHRLAAIDLMASRPTAQTLATLQALTAHEDPAIFVAARKSIRAMRRQLDLVDLAYLPAMPDRPTHLVDLTLEQRGGPGRDIHIEHPEGSRIKSTVFIGRNTPLTTLFRPTIKLDAPGSYFVRITALGPPPECAVASRCEAFFTIEAQGNYRWEVTVEGGAGGNDSPRVFELWQGKQLLERRTIAKDQVAQAVARTRIPLAPPPAMPPAAAHTGAAAQAPAAANGPVRVAAVPANAPLPQRAADNLPAGARVLKGSRIVACRHCKGTGGTFVGQQKIPCGECKGLGRVTQLITEPAK